MITTGKTASSTFRNDLKHGPMEHKALPTYQLETTTYLVDVRCRVLRRADDMLDVLPFADMEDYGTHYATCDDRGKIISIPPMVRLDPEGMADKYAVAVKDLPEQDNHLRCPAQRLADRLQGKLPVVSIQGHDFFVDLRLGVLRPQDEFRTMGIPIKDIEENPAGTGLLLLYDPATKGQIFFSPDWEEIPPGVVCIELPDITTMDVVGTMLTYLDYPELADRYPFGNRQEALEFQWRTDLSAMLDRFPVCGKQEALLIPWEHTRIKELIAENKARKSALSKDRKRPGKGI